MTTFALKLALNREINGLNKVIDQKIKRGESYRKEAQLHKKLLKKLTLFNTRSISGKGSKLALFV